MNEKGHPSNGESIEARIEKSVARRMSLLNTLAAIGLLVLGFIAIQVYSLNRELGEIKTKLEIQTKNIENLTTDIDYLKRQVANLREDIRDLNVPRISPTPRPPREVPGR